MNLDLLDPFVLAQDCPEAFIGGLRCGHSSCIRFDRRGDYLASGRVGFLLKKHNRLDSDAPQHDGTVVIFDVETNGVARKLRGHLKQIQSISWSEDGRYLLSASQDWKCILWDLRDGSRVQTVRFEAAVYLAELHPRNHLLFTAALFDDQPVLVDMSSEVPIKHVLPSAPRRSQIDEEKATERQQTSAAKQATTVVCWSTSGSHILAGTSGGWLNFIDSTKLKTVFSMKVSERIVLALRLTPSGKSLLANSSDRIIRTYHMPDLDQDGLDFDNLHIDIEFKFQDIVNKLSWNNVAFSSTGEYVTASILQDHHLYVWERSKGSLEKILEGPKEVLSSVDWHPYKPFIAATGIESGRVYLWSILTPQRWSALAPDFAEVEENVEYVEREDEFDIHPIEEIQKRILNQEDEDIDVLAVLPEKTSRGSNDFQIPVVYDLDESDSDDDLLAIGAGQYRRKSPGQGREWMEEDHGVK